MPAPRSPRGALAYTSSIDAAIAYTIWMAGVFDA
jgi:hypothetical protein